MFEDLQAYIPLLESYLIAANKEDFFLQIQDPSKRKFLDLFTSPILSVKDFREKAQKLQLDSKLTQQILKHKLKVFAETAKDCSNKQVMKEIKKQFYEKLLDSNSQGEQSESGLQANVNQMEAETSANMVAIEEDLQKYLEKKILEEDEQFYYKLDLYAFSKLSAQFIASLPLTKRSKYIDCYLIKYHFSLSPKQVSRILFDFEKEMRATNQNYEFSFGSINNRQIILSFGEQYPMLFQRKSFATNWIKKKYFAQICNFTNKPSLSDKQIIVYQKILEQMISELESFKENYIFKLHLRKLKNEYLLSQYELREANIDRFIDFLENQPQISNFKQLNEQFSHRLQGRKREETDFENNLFFRKLKVQTFLENYLQLLLKTCTDPEEALRLLDPYFQKNYLRKALTKIQLEKGQIRESFSDLFKKSEFEALKNKSQITIKNKSPSKFKVEQDVKLKVEVKNVKRIEVKVYVTNMTKYLLIGKEGSSQTFSDEIDLSFLEPTAKEILQIHAKNSFEIVSKTIDLSRLIPRKMGVYIVDLQGESVTSRAVIRKGAISCLDNHTEAGQQFSFFDQSGHPLTSEDGLKVWIKGRPAEITSNRAVLAYGEKATDGQIIASVGDFAESFCKCFESQKYDFNVSYLYNAESFVVGRKAKIVLHGRLSIHNTPVSLELLRDTKVRVIITNSQQIKISHDFDIAKWTDASDPTIEFPIQSYASSVRIEVNSKITLLNKKEVTLSSSKEIQIELGEKNGNFHDFYLDQDSKGIYRVTLLGANGEPPLSNVDVIIRYSLIGVDKTEKNQAKTDSQGRIYLGPLSIVRELSAQAINQICAYRQWKIDQNIQQFNYGQFIYLKQGSDFQLPINSCWKRGDLFLQRLVNQYNSENLTSQLKFEGSRLKFPRFEKEGKYKLRVLPINKNISIRVLKSSRWEADISQKQNVQNDKQSDNIYEIKNNLYHNVVIQNVETTPNEESNQVKVSLNLVQVPQQYRKNIRVHIFPINYISPDYLNSFQASSLFVNNQLSIRQLRNTSSLFYNNKIISDQGAYVWNRQQNKQKYVGNSLQKPSIFLKKRLVAETTENTNDLIENEKNLHCGSRGYGGKGKVGTKRTAMRRYARCGEQIAQQKVKNINSHNNFLLLSGDIQTNLSGETVIATIPHGYSAIQVYVITPKSAIKGVFPLQTEVKRQTRDLRHIGLENTDENVGWTMSREVYSLKPGQKQLISKESQWRTVGLSEIFDFASAKSIKLYNWSSDLLAWQSYSEDKKKQVYDRECCHELNTFIRFKDPAFFERVVAPFIKNKLQKTVVDLCLLRDSSAKRFLNLKKIHSLNPFEKCLLVYALCQQKDYQNASKIAEILQLQQKGTKSKRSIFQEGFDSIMLQKSKITVPRAILTAQKLARKSRDKNIEQCDQYMEQEANQSIDQADDSSSHESQPRQNERNENTTNRLTERKKLMNKADTFVQIQNTKEYTERNYYKQSDEENGGVEQSPFWVELSRFFLGRGADFTASSFHYFNNCVQFMLAACFVAEGSASDYDLDAESDRCALTAKVPMLLYVKELKKVEHTKKFGVIMNQRFFDPSNRKAYEEDGTEYDREIDEFIVRQEYALQTVVSNTSGTPLQLQLMLDIPRGAIPLRSHEYTKIANISLDPFSFQSFERFFYFPEEGTYEVCPSNAARGSVIIAKGSPLPSIVVKKAYTTNKLESFEDVLRSGDKEQLLTYIEQRNIFDTKVFRPSSILVLLADANFYSKAISTMRKRSFFDRGVWGFGFLHGDLAAVREIMALSDSEALFPSVFEYFPYYCNRSHQFANEARSTIRNVQLKETYTRFLVGSAVGLRQEDFEVAFAYFLILQDRCKEADELIRQLSPSQYAAHELQLDYMRCFLELSLRTAGFEETRSILGKYRDYPVETWRRLFDAVRETIEAKDEESAAGAERVAVESFETKVIEEGAQFRVVQPAETEITVQLFQVNLEKFFSEFPFDESITFTSIHPSRSLVFPASEKSKDILIRRSDYPELTDVAVDVIELKKGLPPRKVSAFWWGNPEVKVKVNESSGTLQVYVGKQRCPGAYVKVFSDKSSQHQFYRDGYTDIKGSFRYAMADIDGVKQFAILVSTEKGGSIHRVKPPSKLSFF